VRAVVHADNYEDWWVRKVPPRIAVARIELQKFLTTLAQFPPRQRPATFGVDQMMEPLYNQQKSQGQ
jgi:arylsulfatase